MSRRPMAALALALLATLLPLVGSSAQIRVTGVLQGSLVLLPASPTGSGSAAVSPTRLASIAPATGTHAMHSTRSLAFLGSLQSDESEPNGDAAPAPIRAIVSTTRDSLTVWAPDAQRIELRLDNDTLPARTVECRRDSTDPGAPATCDAAGRLPARVILTVYLGLDGSR